MPDPCEAAAEFILKYESKVDSALQNVISKYLPLPFDVNITALIEIVIGDVETYFQTTNSSTTTSHWITQAEKYVNDAIKIMEWIESLRCNPTLLEEALDISIPQIPPIAIITVPTPSELESLIPLEPKAVPGLTTPPTSGLPPPTTT